MASATIGTIKIGLSIATESFGKGLDTARKKLNDFGNNLFSKGINNFTKDLSVAGVAAGAFAGAVAAAGAAVYVIQNLTAAQMENIDVLSKLSSTIDVSTEQLAGWTHGADLSGLSSEELAKNLQTFNRRIGETAAGTGDSLKDIDAYGLSLDSLLSKPLDQAFYEAADGLSKIEDPAVRAAAAVDLFGKAGASSGMLSFIADGSDGIKEMEADAAKLGKTFTSEQGKMVEAANDAYSRMQGALAGVGTQIAVQVAPYIKAAADEFTNWASSGTNLKETIGASLDWIVFGLGTVADVIHFVFMVGKAAWAAQVTQISTVVQMVTFLGKSLESLINLIPGVEVKFTDALSGMNDYLKKTAEDARQGAWDTFLNDTPSMKMKNLVDNVKAGANAMSQAMGIAGRDIGEEVDKGLQKATEKALDFVEKLKLQTETFGMTSNAAEIYKLKQEGVSDVILNQARAYSAQLEKMEASKKKTEELAAASKKRLEEQAKKEEELFKKADSLFAETRTPLEKFKAEVFDLQDLFAKDLIDEDVFTRKLKALETEMASAGESESPRYGAALEYGTAAARTAVLKNDNVAGPINRLAEQARQQHEEELAEQRRHTKALDKIAGDNFMDIETVGFGNV